MKIHYLEDALAKAGPEYNQAALKENSELKVLKLTLQREISRYKKSLEQAERDLESYRLQYQELREKAKRKQADQELQEEMDHMREQIETRDTQVKDFQRKIREAEGSQSEEIDKLRDEVEDLEASLREKDRVIEQRDDAIEELKNKDSEDHDAVSDLGAELQRVRDQLEELHDNLDQARFDARQAKDAEEQAMADKEHAEQDLQELHDEMSNKSFSTKGLTRQLEEKTSKLEEELQGLKQENKSLRRDLESKEQHEARLEERYHTAQQEMDDEERKLQDEIEMANHERDLTQKEHNKTQARLRVANDELQRALEEKDLLQTRHHALTGESGGLQHELDQAQSEIRELRQAVENEKQRARENNHAAQFQHRDEVDRLEEQVAALLREIEDQKRHFAREQDRWESSKRDLQSQTQDQHNEHIEHLEEQLDSLRHSIEDQKRQFARDQDKWETNRRSLQLQKERAEEETAGLKRTVEKLQQVEYSLSGKEVKMQEVIDSEKTRHLDSEAVLSRQINELNEDLASKRQLIDTQRGQLLSTKEDLRVAKREEEALKEKVQALEDEVVVLQSSLEEEQENAKARQEKGDAGQSANLQKLLADKKRLREELSNRRGELEELRSSKADLEAERDDLLQQIDLFDNQTCDVTRIDRERAELRRTIVRLESELQSLKDSKPSVPEEPSVILEEKDSLQDQLDAEIERATAEENRLWAEIDQLQGRLQSSSNGRDRELASARSKAQKLERRIIELEQTIDQQPFDETEHSTVLTDHTALRHDLEETRKREKSLRERVTEQKVSVRTCKARIVELEKELHDALMQRYETESPRPQPNDKAQEELHSLRKQLTYAHQSLKEVKTRNRDLERAALKEEEQNELHEWLKTTTIEAESLAVDVSERDARIEELREQMRQIREERSSFLKMAESASKELEALQDRYNHALEKITAKPDYKAKYEKEIRALGKEITWLRTRLGREECLCSDLVYIKKLLQLEIKKRDDWYVQLYSTICYYADLIYSTARQLKMIAGMGINVPPTRKNHSPRKKLKIAMYMVKASVRMQRWGQEGAEAKKLHQSYKRAKTEMLKRRESSSKSKRALK